MTRQPVCLDCHHLVLVTVQPGGTIAWTCSGCPEDGGCRALGCCDTGWRAVRARRFTKPGQPVVDEHGVTQLLSRLLAELDRAPVPQGTRRRRGPRTPAATGATT